MLVQEMENMSGSNARSVPRTASIEIETSDASTVWDAWYSRVAGVALHLAEALHWKEYKFERISVVVAAVVVVVVVVPHSAYSLYSSTRIILYFMVPDVWWFAPDVLVFIFVKRAPPPTWAASAGPENHNSEVYRDTIKIMLVQEEMENISESKARYVARTASIEIETSAAPAVCETRVTV